MEKFFDFTPDPKVLIALTHTPMLPLDALCELIDNAIDGFAAARIQGIPTEKPIIVVDLPARKDIVGNTGVLRVVDNGPGMTAETAEKAIKAGFSGNNPYDSLGLFGMGFNISTGKIGRVTRFRTARKEDNFCTDTIIDLEKINNTKNYRLPAIESPKPDNFTNGTIIEVSNWWPEGNPNRGFIYKLVQYGLRQIREEIGRRYSTILQTRDIQIIINSEKCEPFEHCTWGENRFVERRIGQISAIYKFDQIIGNQSRCGKCTALIPQGDAECPSCHSTSIRTIEEHVKGWIGIQRFDSLTEYGIDLIRNGRAIRIAEKTAFFEFVDDLKKVTIDYPIDNQYGRIVGEVSLDFVPVDFLKQDFQRSSDEWQRAMRFLRGESSLQPTKPNAENNNSIVFKLYQGYRRVRTFGKADMYMGYWDADSNTAKRISRDVEKDFYSKFKQKLPGYYDDSEWWKKVEEADTKPIEAMVECPTCSAQNLKESDVCAVCGQILRSKHCISESCGAIIPLSAQICPICGSSQVPIVQIPWTCGVCGTRNRSELTICSNCGQIKGTLNPLSLEYLQSVSNKDDSLSLNGFSIQMADGSNSTPVNVNVYVSSEQIVSLRSGAKIPIISFKTIGQIDIFIDKTHRMFRTCRVRPEELISSEIAMFIYDTNRNLNNYCEHNLSNLSWAIMEKGWIDQIEDNPEKLATEISSFLFQIKERLSDIFGTDADILFEELTTQQQRLLADEIITSGGEIAQLGEMRKTGEYLRYVPADFILNIFNQIPEKFFNGGIWDVDYGNVVNGPLGEEAVKHAQQRIKSTYENCLEDLIMLIQYRMTEPISIQRAKLSFEFLSKKWVV
ncbi:MAG: hypothetical protein AWM53_01812 [Candidatus Dichloromethanomonas elyunquensis]|nr:MAG: hypothetical protein AWM53_01812 [Candidatus Dichloromethanomonas elyunquensis]